MVGVKGVGVVGARGGVRGRGGRVGAWWGSRGW